MLKNEPIINASMTTVASEAEELQAKLWQYLRSVDRDGDIDRMAQRIALKHSRGSGVVGYRRDGHELFVHGESTDDDQNTLKVYEIARDGQLLQTATVWNGNDVRRWLEENHFYLDWVASEWR